MAGEHILCKGGSYPEGLGTLSQDTREAYNQMQLEVEFSTELTPPTPTLTEHPKKNLNCTRY